MESHIEPLDGHRVSVASASILKQNVDSVISPKLINFPKLLAGEN